MHADKTPDLTHQRLSLSLNYAVFLYETYNEKKRALRMLKEMINTAIDDFDHWAKDETDLINKLIDLMQNNCTRWS